MLLCVGVNVTVKKIQTVTAHLKPLHNKQQACSLTHSRHFFMNQITSHRDINSKHRIHLFVLDTLASIKVTFN